MSSENSIPGDLVAAIQDLVAIQRDMAESQRMIAEALTQRPDMGHEPLVTVDEERAALAVVAVAKGANTLTAVAKELGIHRTTAGRNLGIRRALEAAVQDRTRDSREAEDYRWHQ